MNTKWNFLIAIALLVMLVGTSTSPAKAEGGLVISPETLPDGTYPDYYSQQLTISGGSGSYTILWVSDTLPQGIHLSYVTGELQGWAGAAGTFTFFVKVQDNNDLTLTTTQQYTLVIGRQTVDVIVLTDPEISASGQGFDIRADLNPFIPDVGTFAFYLDDSGTPILGCEAVPAVGLGAHCAGSADLAAGEHTLTAVLTPNDTWSSRVNPATGTVTHTVGYRIGGTVFEDLNKDGAFGAEEPLTGVDWTIYLDRDCDGTDDLATGLGPNGTYEFTTLLGGPCYRISAATDTPWGQTTKLTDIMSVSQDVTDLDIGAYPLIFLDDLAPKGDIGVPYSFQYSSYGGGTGPFTYTLVENEFGQPSLLPDGLTLSPDGLVSGTPTEGGHFPLGIQITDAHGALSEIFHPYLTITLDGEFTLTSSSNPSIPDEPVTFTLTATGDYFDPGMGTIPPVGLVAFLDGDTPIEGCTQALLNIILGENGMPEAFGNYPATCTVGSLSAGTHTITATFTDPEINWYHNATITLPGGQTVNAPEYQSGGFSAPLDLGGVLNTAKAGQMIPLKWHLLDASGNPVTDLDPASITMTTGAYACPSGVSTDAIEAYATGTSTLQNLGDGYYQMNWKSDKNWTNLCKKLTLKIGSWSGDGFTALFWFKK